VSEHGPRARLDDDERNAELDAGIDPASAAFDALNGEAGSDLSWFMLLRRRVQEHAIASPRYPWWVLWALLVGLFSLNFTFTVFIVALPTVATQFHTSVTVLTWTMVGPLLAYGLAAPILGKTGDIFGHRRLYLFGLLGAMVAALLTALSHDVAMLLFARALDGVQGAATGTASGALINTVFSREERVKAMGWWSLVGGGGPVIGLSLGSPVIAAFGWRALFWSQLVLIVLAFIFVTIVLPRSRGVDDESAEAKARARAEFHRLDWVGSWSLSIGVTLLMLGLSIGPSIGWTSVWTISMFVLSVLAIALFVYRLRHADSPLIPGYYFKRRNFVMPMVVRGCVNFAYFGSFFLFPLLMEQGYGYSVSRVGALALVRPLALALSSPIAGYVAIRVGERRSAVAGVTFLVASLSLFALLQPSSGAWFVAIALALSGLGLGVAMPSTSSVMANEVKVSEFGVMSAAQLLAVQVGEVIGIQVLGTVQQALVRRRDLGHAHPGPSLLATYRPSFVIGAGVAVLGLAAATFVRSIPRTRTPKRSEIAR
jgi:MFS family permease